jgi:excinuclease ABC subunit A
MSPTQDAKIIITGARQHNLKNVNLEIPKNKFIVFTGVSGSGKSSLAMDTIYAEGQRRYVESLSAYARQFLGVMDKPDVDQIIGLSPAIAIDQKTTSRNPRSTVGTITEIYDFLRLLYARVGHPMCPKCGREISRQSSAQISEAILTTASLSPDFKSQKGVRFFIMAPVVKDRKGEFSTLFENLKKQGIVRARVDGEIKNLNENFTLLKNNKHSVDAIVARFVVSKAVLKAQEQEKEIYSRVFEAVETALRLSNGNAIFSIVLDADFDFNENPKNTEDHLFSENLACPFCNISIPEIEPRTFSFNSPHGACPTCDGLGTQLNIDPESLYNPKLSVNEGGFYPWSNISERGSWIGMVVKTVSEEYGIPLNTPIGTLSKKQLDILLNGVEEGKKFRISHITHDGRNNTYFAKFEGLIPNLMRRYKETKSDYIRKEIEKYMVLENCPTCNRARLKKESLSVLIDHKNIFEVTQMAIDEFGDWYKTLVNTFSDKEQTIAETINKEINYRVKFLLDVGLGYLTLGRSSGHLSGGEAQRIRLASQIGSGLSGVLYVLDEPSIGLHQRDQSKLITTLKHLRDIGNTVLVVEHDEETMLESDYIVDFGPGAGEKGGDVIAAGTPSQIMKDPKSVTGRYLSGKKKVGNANADLKSSELELEVIRGKDIRGKSLSLLNATGRNLKNISVDIPLGKFVCITGVSGSGKSTLIMDTLHKSLRHEFGLKNEEKPEPHEGLLGVENINNVIAIDQTPIGRTPKSNPATYTKTFDLIRDLFSKTEEARIRGYKQGRFSFNVKGGRCEACLGEGQLKIEMQFMPDVYVNCEVCGGKRYNREALEIYYKGKNIADVLDMTVENAIDFFGNIPPIRRKLETIYDVGLGYMRLGQPAPTLSGGEAQRVKLAHELSKRPLGSTFYILDEPTTGLHFVDLERLIAIIKRLSAKGHTVVVIEHNLDVIKNSDWVIDLGPEGGDAGGQVLFSGPTNELLKVKESYTAQALRQIQ